MSIYSSMETDTCIQEIAKYFWPVTDKTRVIGFDHKVYSVTLCAPAPQDISWYDKQDYFQHKYIDGFVTYDIPLHTYYRYFVMGYDPVTDTVFYYEDKC